MPIVADLTLNFNLVLAHAQENDAIHRSSQTSF